MTSLSELSRKGGQNLSGLKPLGRAVLVEPYIPEEHKSAIFIPPKVSERSAMVETRAIVLEIGPECWKDEENPRARIGDKVLISRYAGSMAVGPKDGKTYRLINAEDIYCGIEE